jgi:hypothetical protein
MEPIDIEAGAWATQACTLPTADRALRGAEFDGLFAAGVRGIDRVEPTRLRLELQPSREVAGRAAELTVAETDCCSFFTFALTAASGRLLLEITVPPAHAGVLDALADRAAAAAGLSA